MSRRPAPRLVCGLGLIALGSYACKPAWTHSDRRAPVVQFGVFFGGQIQQRSELPLEFDTTRQTQGFRIVFPQPVAQPTRVAWSLNYPAARKGPRGPSNAPRAERTESVTLATGTEHFEQLLALRPNDVAGTYNIRITVDEAIVLDRPFRLVAKQLDVSD